MSEKKSLALNANVPVVKSPKVPAVKAKGAYHEFDDYAEAARILGQRLAACEYGDVAHWYAQLARGREAFERDELYRKLKKYRPDLLNCERDTEITRRVVSEKIGLLLASFPNASPGNGEAYVGMMIEEIIAANPTASALEAACRAVRRNKNFAPTIAEMLKELRAQAEMFDKVLSFWEDDYEWVVKEHTRLVAEARATKEAEAKRKVEWEESKRIAGEMRVMRERAAREAKVRENEENQIMFDVRSMTRRAEHRFLWRYFGLLMLSHGIFLRYEAVAKLRREYIDQFIPPELKQPYVATQADDDSAQGRTTH